MKAFKRKAMKWMEIPINPYQHLSQVGMICPSRQGKLRIPFHSGQAIITEAKKQKANKQTNKQKLHICRGKVLNIFKYMLKKTCLSPDDKFHLITVYIMLRLFSNQMCSWGDIGRKTSVNLPEVCPLIWRLLFPSYLPVIFIVYVYLEQHCKYFNHRGLWNWNPEDSMFY